jgi:hypothetical protein
MGAPQIIEPAVSANENTNVMRSLRWLSCSASLSLVDGLNVFSPAEASYVSAHSALTGAPFWSFFLSLSTSGIMTRRSAASSHATSMYDRTVACVITAS